MKKLLKYGKIKSEREGKNMKLYNVYVHNNRYNYNDCYMVQAEDPVYARNRAVQRLIDETSHGLDEWEITEVKHIKED